MVRLGPCILANCTSADTQKRTGGSHLREPCWFFEFEVSNVEIGKNWIKIFVLSQNLVQKNIPGSDIPTKPSLSWGRETFPTWSDGNADYPWSGFRAVFFTTKTLKKLQMTLFLHQNFYFVFTIWWKSTLARHAARASTVILEFRPADAGLTRPVST